MKIRVKRKISAGIKLIIKKGIHLKLFYSPYPDPMRTQHTIIFWVFPVLWEHNSSKYLYYQLG